MNQLLITINQSLKKKETVIDNNESIIENNE